MFARCLPAAGLAFALAISSPSAAQSNSESKAAASAELPDLRFRPTPEIVADFAKFFYFHRDDVDFETAHADIRECDGYARGLSSGVADGAAIYGALGNVIADVVHGAAIRREQRRLNMRTCMGLKGYQVYGLPKDIWSQFNFEEGNSAVEEVRRQDLLALQAKAASGPRPTFLPVTEFGKGNLVTAVSPALDAVPKAPRQFDAKAPVVLDKAMAYVYFRMPVRGTIVLLRAVTAEERSAWETARAEALAKAQAKYQRDLNRYHAAMKVYVPVPGIGAPEKPKTVEESFVFPPPEADNLVAIGPRPQFDKGQSDFGYLAGVAPGTYTIYAEVTASSVAVGFCLCMGSVSFDARPGLVANLGRFTFPRMQLLEGKKGRPVLSQELLTTPALGLEPPTGPLPGRLSSAPVVPAELRASDKLDNQLGIVITRFAPVEGVLGYQRDKVLTLGKGD